MEVKREAVLARQRPEINSKLKDVTVAILGAGGLGSNVAMMLARLGIGRLILYDYDVVEASNLNRQNYGVRDIGKKKVERTKAHLQEMLPYVEVEARDRYVDGGELERLYDEADIVIEAFDGVESKVLAYDYFCEREKPYICTTGVAGIHGKLRRKDLNNIYVVGDFHGENRNDCYMPKVMAIAAMECRVVLELIDQEEDIHG
ncbi:MAG: sulfur carrier protein ThiS adenylyltransferase ThiF [Peptoniphilus sp.]|nr:sulfur carrier protein ThiS adenylyltransferase ThiF [Peptoniphilus sp.]MDD7363048.1 sulfur carrier protein ThiS adenylyltransferase ThiF [Bacillota bacterium]MDY6045313.1 sulfur carrier protein ThiS adenylyltransferase ThiF [Peptoniphilus sp.]